MDRNVVKSFAIWARQELIQRVTLKAAEYGIEKDKKIDEDATSHIGYVFNEEEVEKRKKLIERVEEIGFDETIEEVAYTWFNRFIALRFMEINGYLPCKMRIFTDEENRFEPQILKEIASAEICGIHLEKVNEYLANCDREGVFRYIILCECNDLGRILPQIFKEIDDYCELLFPDNLLREDSVIDTMIKMIPQEEWKNQVQIIGWLYQYYNSEVKEEVFADLKRNKKITKDRIPAATQLFTPDWIVRYMVENSLGKLWILGHGNSDISKNWRYYLDSPPQSEDTLEKLAAMKENYKNKNPEEIRCIDPCVGSGHVLCYLFDILIEIYESCGYKRRDAVSLIIEKNLYGLDIDKRAVQLAYFSVMMKALEYDKRFLSRKYQPQPNIFTVEGSNCFKDGKEEEIKSFADGDLNLENSIHSIVEDMYDADEYGSIIDVREVDFNSLYRRFDGMNEREKRRFLPLINLIKTAEVLSEKYDIVVTNPPYMGSFGMNQKLQKYVKKHYKESKLDLFAVFIEKWCTMLKPYGFNAMVTMQSWMFLSGFEELRKSIFENVTISSLLHMDIMVMGIAFGTSATVFVNMPCDRYQGRYSYITMDDIRDGVPVEFPVKERSFSQVSLEQFKKIPGIPIAYWVDKKVGDIFSNLPPMSSFGDSKSGLQTGNNNLFLRMWYEVDIKKINFNIENMDMCKKMKEKWIPHPKGGAYRKWYGNQEYVVNFQNDAYDMRNYKGTALIKNQNYYFKEGATWSHTTSSFFSARYMPPGCIFNVEAPTFYSFEDYNLFYILGFINTNVLDLLFGCMTQTMHYMAGDMAKIPLVYDSTKLDIVKKIVQECIEIAKADWDMNEISWNFKTSPILENRVDGKIESAYLKYRSEVNGRFERLKYLEEKLNSIFIKLYGLNMKPDISPKDVTVAKIFENRDDIGDEIKGNRYILTREDVVKNFISYFVGRTLGRYSNEGLLREEIPSVIIPITEDEYFQDDILSLFIRFLEQEFGVDNLEENIDFIGGALRGKGSSREKIRNYFVNDFYKDHCKMYQKKPIYWQFESGRKNGFKALIYIHGYRPDVVARVRVGYVHEVQSRYKEELGQLDIRLEKSRNSERVRVNKKITDIREKIVELEKFEENIHHIADLMIELDLDDGVKENYKKFGDILGKIL